MALRPVVICFSSSAIRIFPFFMLSHALAPTCVRTYVRREGTPEKDRRRCCRSGSPHPWRLAPLADPSRSPFRRRTPIVSPYHLPHRGGRSLRLVCPALAGAPSRAPVAPPWLTPSSPRHRSLADQRPPANRRPTGPPAPATS